MNQSDPRRPGNVVLRRSRVRPETVQVSRRRLHVTFHPQLWMVPLAFALIIALGTLLLALPSAAEARTWTNGWDALFTATSAVSVTGLVRVDTADHWSGFGEVVILTLIQAGGLGVTIYAGMLLLIAGRHFGLRGRAFFGFELLSVGERDIRRLLRRVMIYVATVEALTFILLLPWFLNHTDGTGLGIWRAFFHAISAFNNAGFDIMGGRASFTGQIASPYLLVVMGFAALLGSLSFVTVFNLRKRPRWWSLDTRLVIVGMGALLVLALLLFALGEVQTGRVLDRAGVGDIIANGFFLSVNRTTGMTTVDMSAIRESTTIIVLALMFVGGASTSTASGIKIGTFMVVLIAALSSLKRRSRAEVFGREIPEPVILRAVAVVILGLMTLVLGAWIVSWTDQDAPFLPLLFEVTSALANVGWSQGLTANLSAGGAITLTALMFIGRLGPLMIALSVPERPEVRYRYPTEGVRIG